VLSFKRVTNLSWKGPADQRRGVEPRNEKVTNLSRAPAQRPIGLPHGGRSGRNVPNGRAAVGDPRLDFIAPPTDQRSEAHGRRHFSAVAQAVNVPSGASAQKRRNGANIQ
jgi:hypothetical protein